MKSRGPCETKPFHALQGLVLTVPRCIFGQGPSRCLDPWDSSKGLGHFGYGFSKFHTERDRCSQSMPSYLSGKGNDDEALIGDETLGNSHASWARDTMHIHHDSHYAYSPYTEIEASYLEDP